MKLAHIGYGGMGQAVAAQAAERGHDISTVIEAQTAITPERLSGVDIAIECTVPSAFWGNLTALCAAKQDVVIVTTGWYDELDRARVMVEKAGTRVIWSSNYSIGVNVYFRMIEAAAKLMDKVEEYDVWGHEIHHKNKIDSPSGTAKTLETILLENITRKTVTVEATLQRKIEDHEIHFSSTRGGLVNFGHTIGFDSAADCIELKHTARNRDGYALGAVKGAEWLKQQPPGFYSMEDYLTAVFKES